MAAVNYVAAAAGLDPTVSFAHLGDVHDYNSLVWNGTPIPEYNLEVYWLNVEKKRIIDNLTDSMISEVQSGFMADVLEPGTFRRYDTSIQGQIGIIGAQVYSTRDIDHPTGHSFRVASYDSVYGLIGIHEYTADQISALIDVFATFSENLMEKLTTKVNQIIAIDDVHPHHSLDLVYAITWD